jgi:hypothetical protein
MSPAVAQSAAQPITHLAGAASLAAQAEDELNQSLEMVEQHLTSLGQAVRGRDSDAIDRNAVLLHKALATAVDRFSSAARRGRIPEPLRKRLAAASGQVAAQRESLARATAALDRAIDVLIPREASAAAYGPIGRNDRTTYGHLVA